MNILFVDDLPDTCEVFKLAFRLEGHNTTVAHDGREALSLAGSEKFDAIIMDVEMPVMNGWDSVSKIRQLPSGGSIPIIMFTAYGTAADREHALEVGANDLVQKPVQPRELINRIKALSVN